MSSSRKVIICCAVTGGIHTPSMSPHLPVTPDEIAEAAIGAAEAGAAMIHFHARIPSNGRPSQDPALFKPFLQEVKRRTNVIINITTGGGMGMTLEERIAPALAFAPEVCSLNMGTFNLGLFRVLRKLKEFRYDWEEAYLANPDLMLRNTFGDIENFITRLSPKGTKFEFECYDGSHLYNVAYFAEQGLIKPPFYIQTCFGLMGGIGVHPEDVTYMKRTADRLFGDQYHWSVLGAGKDQMPIAAMAASMGGNVRVGLEDSLYLDKGRLATSNAEQVSRAREIIERLGLDVATPDEARALLKTKGAANTSIA